MAFGKWRFSRGRKGSSGSAGSGATTNGTTTPVDDGRSYTKSQPEESSQPRILRSLTGSFTARPQRPRKLSEKDQEYARLHKPFTKQNLEHQKILASFEFNFGSRTAATANQNQRAMSICSGISPCTSRRGSVQHDNLFPPSSRTDTHGRSGNDLTHKVPLDRLRID